MPRRQRLSWICCGKTSQTPGAAACRSCPWVCITLDIVRRDNKQGALAVKVPWHDLGLLKDGWASAQALSRGLAGCSKLLHRWSGASHDIWPWVAGTQARCRPPTPTHSRPSTSLTQSSCTQPLSTLRTRWFPPACCRCKPCLFAQRPISTPASGGRPAWHDQEHLRHVPSSRCQRGMRPRSSTPLAGACTRSSASLL